MVAKKGICGGIAYYKVNKSPKTLKNLTQMNLINSVEVSEIPHKVFKSILIITINISKDFSDLNIIA